MNETLAIKSARRPAMLISSQVLGAALVALLLWLPPQKPSSQYPPGQWDHVIDGVTFTRTLSLDSGDDNTLIIGAVFHSIDDHALMLRNVSNVYIKDCVIYDVTGFGILLRGSGSTHNVTIDGCRIYSTGGSGILAGQDFSEGVNHYNLVIKNNLVYSNGNTDHEHNIYVQSSDSLIENNTVYNSPGNGISLRSTGVVRNNNIWNSAKSCIRYYSDHAPGLSGEVVIENNLCLLSAAGFDGSPGLSLLESSGSPSSWLADRYVIRGNTVVLHSDERYGFEAQSAAFDGKQVVVEDNVFINTTDIDLGYRSRYIYSAVNNQLSDSLNDFPEVIQALGVFNPAVLINAVYHNTYLPDDPEEAFQLMNMAGAPLNLTGWTVTDFEGTVGLTGTLAAGQAVWVARQADDFYQEFGFRPDYEYQADTDPQVPDLPLTGTLILANAGDQLLVQDSQSHLIDALVYGGGSTTATDWQGATTGPFTQGFVSVEQGQLLHRKRDQTTGLPVMDSDSAADWAQATDDPINGKKVRYPGWDLDRFFFTRPMTHSATITYVVAPDAIYDVVADFIGRASHSIYYQGYTFDNAHLADALSATLVANPGLTVTMLLEGAPVGGIGDQQKRNCQVVEAAGGQCWFMIDDSSASPPIHDRYAFQHAKFMVIDRKYLLTGSENLNYAAMPADDKSDGTRGNRGVWLIADSPELAAFALDIFDRDLDPAHHRDLLRWRAPDARYGAPPDGFVPDYSSGGSGYTATFTTPFSASGEFFFEVVQSPENSLRSVDGLLGLVGRAGSGDTVLAEQLYEHKYWGQTSSNPTIDPNPRLESYIDAARRGAAVYLLLDSAYDDSSDPRGNSATCSYVSGIAASERLNLRCLTGNPTGSGIHNKMVLVQADGQGWVHTGSINGSENSSKNNRELAVQVKTSDGYSYLADVFWYDWEQAGGRRPGSSRVYLPVVLKKQ